MKIMIFSRAEWDDCRSLGNTLTALFGGETWKNDQFSSIYFRSAKPNNPVCREYYQIRPAELLKGICFPGAIGRHFSWDGNCEAKKSREGKCIELLHRIPSAAVYELWESMARKGAWVNDRLIAWLKAQNPDLFFSYLGDDGIMEPMLRAVKKYTHAKIVLYGLDDVYGYSQRLPGIRGRKAAGAMEAAVRQADLLYGISQEMCREYGRIFLRPFSLLQKGCQWQNVEKKGRSPVEFIYAGNLRYGRAETLVLVAEALQQAKKSGLHAVLNIYTGSPVPAAIREKLENTGISRIRGQRPYGELQKILAAADVVLEAESFRKEEKERVRLSFSTKIMDCLQCGGVPLAIGPKGVGSINFLEKIPGAVVLTDPEQVEMKIFSLLQNRDQLPKMAETVRAYAMKHHDGRRVREKLRQEFLDLLS